MNVLMNLVKIHQAKRERKRSGGRKDPGTPLPKTHTNDFSLIHTMILLTPNIKSLSWSFCDV